MKRTWVSTTQSLTRWPLSNILESSARSFGWPPGNSKTFLSLVSLSLWSLSILKLATVSTTQSLWPFLSTVSSRSLLVWSSKRTKTRWSTLSKQCYRRVYWSSVNATGGSRWEWLCSYLVVSLFPKVSKIYCNLTSLSFTPPTTGEVYSLSSFRTDPAPRFASTAWKQTSWTHRQLSQPVFSAFW